MSILLWLLPSVIATAAAMALVSFLGRERPERRSSDVQQARMGEALQRPLPKARPRPAQQTRPVDSTGVAVRPASTRRSA